MMAEPTAFSWLCLQESLLKAPNTVEAYARGVDDWLRFCHQNDVSPTEASREILALYVRHLNITRNLAARIERIHISERKHQLVPRVLCMNAITTPNICSSSG